MKQTALAVTLVVTMLTAYQSSAQDFSNKGKEFWIAYPAHIDGTGSVMGVYITSEVNSSGTLVAGGTTVPFTVTANHVTTIFLGPNGGGAASNIPVYLNQHDVVLPSTGIKIISDRDIIVYAHIIKSARSAATLVLPTKVWGREYIVPSHNNVGQQGADAGYGEFAILASKPNTTIEIIPSVNGRTGVPVAGIPYQVTLKNPGDIYFFQGLQHADISGTIIRSVQGGVEPCKPIAVFSATTWSAFDCINASGGDNLFQQLFPTGAWGRTFVTAPFINRPYDIIRVYVKDAATTVTKTESGVTTQLTSFNATGLFFEFKTTNPTILNASQPVSVVQYIVSQTCDNHIPNRLADPEMTILNPIDQTLSNITVFSAHQNYVPPGQTQVTQHYLNIIIPTARAASLLIDNALPTSSFNQIPGTNYSYIQEDVTASSAVNPVHNIKADTGFTAIAYGYGNVESYGYNAGTNVIDRYQFISVQNQYATVNFPASCKGTPFYFFMTFPYQPTEITWQFFGLFADITIGSPIHDSTWTVDGRKLYRYKLPNPYAINNQGTYPIRVIAQNPTADGCSGEQQIDYDLQVFDPPQADFNIIGNGCASDTVYFNDNSNTGGRSVIKWYWDFADGSIDSIRNTKHRYLASGTFEIHHSLITDVGCLSDTTKKTIVLNDPPVSQFSVSSPNCIGKAISFTDMSHSNAATPLVKWYWDFGDGTPPVIATNNSTQTHIFNTAGTFSVTLAVETNSGCRSYLFKQAITIHPNPVAAFSFTDACLPAGTAQFTNQSTIIDGTQNLFSYQWNFGDGNTSALQNPVHNYGSTGPFNVTLTVISNNACSDDSIRVMNTIYQQPEAAFTIDKTESCLGGTFVFTDQSTAANNTVTKWFWDFGDGSVSNLQNPTKTYAAAQSYIVTLRVVSAAGCSSVTTTKTIVVNPLPTSAFNVSLPNCSTQNITFTDASSANAGNLVKWTWNYDDGTNSILANGSPFTHLYSTAATYTVTLQVQTDKGCVSALLSKPVIVSPLPVAAFLLPENCLNDPFSAFTDASTIADETQSQFTYMWNFADPNANAANPNTSTLKNPQHKYNAVGVYNVELNVTSNKGCSANTTVPFTINGSIPKSIFTVQSGNSICSNQEISIMNNSTVDFGKIVKLEVYWDYTNNPTDKIIDDDPRPGKLYTFRYPEFGTPATKNISIRVVAYSGDNCLSTSTQVIVLQATPTIQFDAMNNVCSDVTPFQITQATEINNMPGTGIFTGADVSSSGLFNPATAGIGVHIIRFTFNNTNGCSNFKEQVIQVYPQPKANAGPDRVVLEGGTITLIGAGSGANGLSYLWTPGIFLSNNKIVNPQASPVNDISYVLTVTSIDGCKDSDEVFVKVLKIPVIPNVFTPNGDGINDKWVIAYLESYPGCSVEIYSRYGQIVYRSVGYDKPWDGTYKGKEVPAGTYYYIVDPKNGRKRMAGFVDVVR